MPSPDVLEREERDQMLSRRALAGIFFLALVVRLGALLELHGSPWNEVLLGDARAFDEWGQRLAAGQASAGVFYQAPLYAYVLGALYAVFGHSLLLVRVLQCALGALAAVAVARATERLGSRRAAGVAGVLAALYAPAIWYDLQLEKTSLATSLTAGILLLTSARERRESWALASGVALGALVLLRENAAVLLLPLGLAAWQAQPARRVRRLGLLTLAFVLALAPVAWHNWNEGGLLLPTASNAGVNFYIGNAAEADGQYRPLVAGRGHPDYEREDATRIAETLSGHALSPAGVSSFWFARAGEEIAAEPAHFLLLLGRKLRLLCAHAEIMDAVAFESFQDEAWVLRVLGLAGFGVLLPLALAGMVLGARRGAVRFWRLAAALVALSIVAFFVVGRFRLGLVPFLFPFAALALDAVLGKDPRARARRSAALAALALGVALAWWPLGLEGDARATSAANLAAELLRRNDDVAAERWARVARTRDPRSAEAAYNLGLALRRQGKDAEARDAFEAALELEPAYAADCLVELGALALRGGDRARARELFARALALEPGNAIARRSLLELERARER
ncbi:MAG: tetratricopeptide repeat protein [Planctomycetes bacterium]|nr:tetratricopeptide repeat protein [Planctomycetota bacterium]